VEVRHDRGGWRQAHRESIEDVPAIAKPNRIERQVLKRATLDQLAASVKASVPSVNRQAIAALAGQWILWDGKRYPVTTSIGNRLVFKGTKGQLAVDFQLGNGQLLAAGKRYVRQ
jgi:hypothetical protein